jgi:hypothetical protein
MWKRLCVIPSIGPIRAAELLGILQTPHRFRSKRQLWTYCGLSVVTSSSADHEVAKGQLRRKKKHVQIRGLNENCNHDLKNLFKGAAVVASIKSDPLAEFYAALLAKGMRPQMARLTLVRKIATIAGSCKAYSLSAIEAEFKCLISARRLHSTCTVRFLLSADATHNECAPFFHVAALFSAANTLAAGLGIQPCGASA